MNKSAMNAALVWLAGIIPLATGLLLPAAAEPGPSRTTDGARAPVVVELFTSQGCYSCPPAEAFLGELADDPGVIALEFHVDYWDDLVYGASGRWKDPFSAAEHTARQRRYNERNQGTGRVYTPQIVVDGREETVGSRRGAVRRAMAATAGIDKPVQVAVRQGDNGTLLIDLSGDRMVSGLVWLVRFHDHRITDVRAGENKGKTLTSRNIVTMVQRVGEWTGRPTRLDLARAMTDDDQGCAVLVQSGRQGPILGAARCPDNPS